MKTITLAIGLLATAGLVATTAADARTYKSKHYNTHASMRSGATTGARTNSNASTNTEQKWGNVGPGQSNSNVPK